MLSFFRQKFLTQSHLSYQMVRPLLTSQQIGMDRFLKQKENNINTNKETLVNNIKKSLETDGFVYTEDLKGLAYSIDTPEDVKLLKEAVIKFASKDESLRLEDFKIGPVICRALFHIDDLDTLKELIENEKTSKHFQLRSTYNIYLTFLYKKEKYDEVLNYGEKVLNQIFAEDRITARFELDKILVLYLAAANKIGNKDALERSRKMIHDFKENISKKGIDRRETRLRYKHIMLYHLICLKNNEVSEAMESIAAIKSFDHYEFLNAKAAVLVRLGRTQECLNVIDKILESDPNQNRPKYVFTETIEIIKNELEKNPNDELKSKIESLNQDVILDAKIEDIILALPNPQLNASASRNQQFDRNQQFNRNRFNQRPSRSFNRIDDNRSGFNRFNDRQSNFNNRFNNNRFNNDFADGSRRPFRPFQTRFKAEESSDFI